MLIIIGILLNSKDSTLYKYLGSLLHENAPLPWEELIQETDKYLEMFPPEAFLGTKLKKE